MAAFEVRYVAGMAKSVDAGDLKSPGHSDHAGSTPAPGTNEAPEERHCNACGTSLWFVEESPMPNKCIPCYWEKCDEDREYFFASERHVYYIDLLCKLTGLKLVDLLKNPCSGTD